MQAPQQRRSACAPPFYSFFIFEFLSSVQQRHINVNATMAHCFDVGATLHTRKTKNDRSYPCGLSSVQQRCINVDVTLAYCVDVYATLHRSCHKKEKKMTAPTHAGSSTTRIGMRATSLPFILFSTFYPAFSNAVLTSMQRWHIALTSMRRCIEVKCPLGIPSFTITKV